MSGVPYNTVRMWSRVRVKRLSWRTMGKSVWEAQASREGGCRTHETGTVEGVGT